MNLYKSHQSIIDLMDCIAAIPSVDPETRERARSLGLSFRLREITRWPRPR